MPHSHLRRHGAHQGKRAPAPRPHPVPPERLPFLSISNGPTLVKRDSAATTSSTYHSCSANDDSSYCEKPTSTMSSATLPVVLGVVIPIVCAMVVLFIMHRRHLKKLRSEDANDKHKSLDFGMDVVESGSGAQMTEKSDRKGGKGMSLDMMASPYLLPPGLNGSRDSLRSLSRSISAEDDKYRPATAYLSDTASMRSYPHFSKYGQDDASSIGGGSRLGPDDMNQNLLQNAQRMSQSSPPRTRDPMAHHNDAADHPNSENAIREPRLPSMAFIPPGMPQRGQQTPAGDLNRSNVNEAAHYKGSSDLPGQAQSTAVHSTEDEALPGQAVTTRESVKTPPLSPELKSPFSVESFSAQMVTDSSEPSESTVARQPPRISLPFSDGASDYGDMPKFDSDIPAVNISSAEEDDKQNKEEAGHPKGPLPEPTSASAVEYTYDNRRLTLGIRPLPPEDPSDNAEQRANRIRSFYKEYFDDSKPGPEEYSEPFGPEFYGDGAVYDPVTGDILTGPQRPWAEPVGRRAMTPPPRAPPRFQGAARHRPTGSGSGFMPPGPRAFSSASGRLPGPPRGPKKPAPPPAPLHILPTPHALKDDMMVLPIDYAPGPNVKDRREGRPESPMGGLRPFSPAVRAHSPLVSSFDDLAVIPSPHALRKSGTFTTLDFVAPPRFRGMDTGSDAGSIRSNRTGVSAIHAHNIRAGAYRVSRLPTDAVGTKDDLATSLRPKWDMNY